jgi:hypothetical protein
MVQLIEVHAIQRRTFMALVSGGLLAAPRAVKAQRAGRLTIGALYLGGRQDMAPFRQIFQQGLRERGYVEGENVAIDSGAFAGLTSDGRIMVGWTLMFLLWRKARDQRRLFVNSERQ